VRDLVAKGLLLGLLRLYSWTATRVLPCFVQVVDVCLFSSDLRALEWVHRIISELRNCSSLPSSCLAFRSATPRLLLLCWRLRAVGDHGRSRSGLSFSLSLG